jgi:hypothetical protein
MLAGYLMLTGGVAAGLQVARGVVRGAGKLLKGEPQAALGEVVGGFLAPVQTIYVQGCRLVGDIAEVAGSIAGEKEDEVLALAESTPGRTRSRKAVPVSNGAVS